MNENRQLTPPPEGREQLPELLQAWQGESHNLLQILIEVQQRYRSIDRETVAWLAQQLRLSPLQIDGVIDFYSFLHPHDPGQFRLLISDNIIEQLQGSRALAERLASRLGVTVGGAVRADARLSIDYTSCIGMSDQGPALLVNGWTIPALTTARIDQIAELVEEGRELTAWPQELFRVAPGVRRSDLLLATEHPDGAALTALLREGGAALLQQLEQSGLRGRGGAGFKTALKWKLCRDAAASSPNQRVVVCNADEGEPGTFKDRLLLQEYADRMFDGMTLCAGIIGASTGFVYLRGEYRYLLEPLRQELARRREVGLLGAALHDRLGFAFDIEIHLGAGAYICGEESALLESLEGKRGHPRNRPPFPVTRGYRGYPTVVNNVETFVAAAMIAVHGAEWFCRVGSAASSGTKLLSISGDCARPGIYEFPYGVTLQQLLEECGAVDPQAVQVAGAAGRMVPARDFGRRIAFEDLATGGSLMIFNQQRDLLAVVRNFADFFAHESCGFCTPCRVGTTLIQRGIAKLQADQGSAEDLEHLRQLAGVMRRTSHCGLGTTATVALLDLLEQFAHVTHQVAQRPFGPAFDLDSALQEARESGEAHATEQQGG